MAMTNRRPCLRRTHGPCDREVSDTDTDGDGTADCVDGCSADPGKSEPGVCGCGVADTDTDGDGTADCVDRCDDNPALVESTRCGCEIETDEDGDGVPGCIDACPADPDKSESEGVCGCGVADTDTDDDGRYDCVDQCPLDPGKSEPGVCGCGVADTDTDGDGTADCIDPVIILTKSADPVSVPETGGPVTFTFKVDNTGPVAVELDGLSDTVFGNLDGQESCATGGVIPTDGSYSCTVTRTLAADDLATHTNKASAVVSSAEGVQGNATDTAAVAFTDVAPTVTLAKTVTGPSSQLESEATFGYELAITNTSAETVTIQKLTDDHTLSRGCENLINTEIAAGKTATCAYTVQQSKPGEIANTATVTVVDNDGSTATANASASVTVRPLPTLRLAVAPTSDDGGDATMDDWTLSAMAVQPAGDAFNFATPGGSGVIHKVHPGITYTLGSAGPDGYTAGSWTCDGGTVAGASVAVMEGHNVTCTLATDDIATPPWTFPEKATLKVKALKKAKKIRSAGRTKLVRKISVGEGQTASVTVKILPKKARKTVTVKKTKQRVVVRTGNAPRKTRIRVRITSGGSGYSTTTWVRTWRVR